LEELPRGGVLCRDDDVQALMVSSGWAFALAEGAHCLTFVVPELESSYFHAMPKHDRSFLLHGAKRNEILTLEEVRQYGIDSFNDPDYLSLYGMRPAEWYAIGVRLLGRTAVECTRDVLADRIARDISRVTACLPAWTPVTAIDPFAGSCNTLYWILRHVKAAQGIAFELDPQVFDLTSRNIAHLNRAIALSRGDFLAGLAGHELPPGHALVMFVAPPWGTALDESEGLDLSRTEPPIIQIIEDVSRRYAGRRILFATQVYEKLEPRSFAKLEGMLEWCQLAVYNFNASGRNHGILLGAKGWMPS
jgi:hypothetical protein